MQTKLARARVEIKDADKGTVDLVFSTYDVVDSDGDVTPPGAFEHGAKAAVSAYGHTSWEGKLPVGVATIHSTGSKEARASAQFFMDTQHGADTFRTVKELHKAGLGDWSYGYDVLKHSFGDWGEAPNTRKVRFLESLKVHEISPVLVGAGVNTRTLAAKARKSTEDGGTTMPVFHGAIRPHETATTDEPWTPAAKAWGLDATVADLRAVHAWYDATGDPETKASYAFMHHGTADGPANVRACLLGIAALNAGTGPDVPAGAKQAVYDHLAGHLRDADVWVPDLYAETDDRSTVKANDAALMVLADLGGLLDHFADVGASRALKGRTMTKANQALLGWVREELTRLDGMLGAPTDLEGFDPDHELARFIHASRRL